MPTNSDLITPDINLEPVKLTNFELPTCSSHNQQEIAPAQRHSAAFTAPKTLLLDLATLTGWAVMVNGEIIESGTLVLATERELRQQRKDGKERTCDVRFICLLDFISSKVAQGVRRIVFEDVIFIRDRAAGQLWASFRTAVWAAVWRFQIQVFCVPVATLKVFAADDGGAQKLAMAQALAKADPTQYVADPQTGVLRWNGHLLDDNEVDAIWLARYTAAVDRGEQKFLSVHERKAAEEAEQRVKRAAAKAKKRAHKEAQKADAKAKRLTLKMAIKAAGRCCGVFRKPLPYNRALCPKCGGTIKITLEPVLNFSQKGFRASA